MWTMLKKLLKRVLVGNRSTQSEKKLYLAFKYHEDLKKIKKNSNTLRKSKWFLYTIVNFHEF